MKILCFIDSLGSGGAQKQLVELAIGFKKKGNQLSFLTYHKETFYYEILEKEAINITCIQESNYVKRLFKIRKFIRKGNFDIVLSFLTAANFIAEFAGIPHKNWKLIVGERSTNPNIYRSAKLKLYRLFHFFSDYIVANSHANMKIIREINPLLNQKKCKVIYNLIDFDNIDRQSNNETDNNSTKKNNTLTLIIAANHRYLKNLDGLIEAIKLLEKKEQKKVKIDWYGKPIDKSFEKAMNKIKNYRFEQIISLHPVTHEIISLMNSADAIGLFSFYEGFPNAVCEGMACKKVVISTAVSDIPKFLSHDENLLCVPESPQSIRNAIRYFINLSEKQRTQIGLQNREIAEKYFRNKVIISQYLDLFEYEK